jgi:hypothetical protein
MESLLGLGTSIVFITPDECEGRGEDIQLRMPAEQIRSVLIARLRSKGKYGA